MYIREQIVKTPEEEGVLLRYQRLTREFEEIREYCRRKGETITGYTRNRDKVILRIEDILYFEAVGDLVFAYLETEVYEVKSRLYQLEERMGRSSMKRASKSILVNVEKIVSVRSALNGRLYAKMENSEEILISRRYAKQIASSILEEEHHEGL